MEDITTKIKEIIKRNKITNDIVTSEDYRLHLWKNDIFYLAMDDKYNFTGVHLKKGLFGWRISSRINLEGISFSEKEIEPITPVVINLVRCQLVTIRYQMKLFNKVEVNHQPVKTFNIDEFEKVFGFILVDKKSKKIVEGYNFAAQVSYRNDITNQESFL